MIKATQVIFKTRDHYAILLIYLAMIILVFAINMPYPEDDLLRDIVAGDYGYNYANLYIHAPLMASYNQYIFFDIILHYMSHLIGRIATAHTFQIICMLGYLVPLLIMSYRLLKARNDRYYLMTLLMILALNNSALLRIVLARPEMLYSCWILIGLAVKDYARLKLVWYMGGFLLIPCYWLSFLYVPAIFVVFNSRISKIILSLLFILATAIFWQWYSNYQWLPSIFELKLLLKNRIPQIGENKSIVLLLFHPLTACALVFYLYLIRDRIGQAISWLMNFKYKPNVRTKLKYGILVNHVINYMNRTLFSNSPTAIICLLLAYFTSLHMIRYAAIITGLFVILFVRELAKSEQLQINTNLARSIVLMLVIFMPLQVDCYTSIPKFNLPANSIALTTNLANYFVPFTSTAKIKVAPCMEIGANDRQVQQMLEDIDVKGTLDCKQLKKFGFTHVVEKNLKVVPECLAIYQIQPGWRVWRVIDTQ
ncbi:hypothetical protein [Aquella oligotrophica]|uniref:Glycosyltransferase RgtA/B/C/D-like domain-containing protein n=1 Tax=Aquella oligotrophica TaxID=2067065 RepID=A0A2I7N6E5_9NEIS|nr:hypothetical protein [Aquella oligotrophica]AUR52043.1 hypothetical protein CUN60_06935 [Aquella oligotrophica]